MERKLGPEEIFCSTPSCTCHVAPSERFCSEECRLLDEREYDGVCSCMHKTCTATSAEDQSEA